MEENLDSPQTRRAAERRTRSSRAKVPRKPSQQRTAAVNTAGYKCVDKGESGLVGERSGNHPKLTYLIIALTCNQIYMVRKSELRIKHGTEVAHTRREGCVREERGEPLTVNLRELPVTTEPDGPSLRGIEKKAVSSHPGSKYVNSSSALGQFPQPTDQYEHRPGHHQQISDATTQHVYTYIGSVVSPLVLGRFQKEWPVIDVL